MSQLADSVTGAKKRGGASTTSGGLVGRLTKLASQRQSTGRTSGGRVATASRLVSKQAKPTILSDTSGRKQEKLGRRS